MRGGCGDRDTGSLEIAPTEHMGVHAMQMERPGDAGLLSKDTLVAGDIPIAGAASDPDVDVSLDVEI